MTACVWGQGEGVTAAGQAEGAAAAACCQWEECQTVAGWLEQQLTGWDWERMERQLDSWSSVGQDYQQLG